MTNSFLESKKTGKIQQCGGEEDQHIIKRRNSVSACGVRAGYNNVQSSQLLSSPLKAKDCLRRKLKTSKYEYNEENSTFESWKMSCCDLNMFEALKFLFLHNNALVIFEDLTAIRKKSYSNLSTCSQLEETLTLMMSLFTSQLRIKRLPPWKLSRVANAASQYYKLLCLVSNKP